MASRSEVRQFIQRRFEALKVAVNTQADAALETIRKSEEAKDKALVERAEAVLKKAKISVVPNGSGDNRSGHVQISASGYYIRSADWVAANDARNAKIKAINAARDTLIDESLIAGSDPAFIAQINAVLAKFS